MDQIDRKLKEYLSVLDNEYVSTALSLFLVLYAGMAAPKLPERVARLFESTLFRILVFFLIAYSAKKNASIAAIAAIGLMVSLQTLNRYDFNNSLKSVIRDSEYPEAEEAEASGEAPESMPELMPEVMPTSVVESEVIPEGVPEGVMESDLSDLGEEEMAQEIPEEMKQNVPQEMEQELPQELIMEEIQEGVPECTSGGCNLVKKNLSPQQVTSINAHTSRREQQELDGYEGGSGFAPI